MERRIIVLCVFLIAFLFHVHAQQKAFLVKNNVAVFYPDGYQKNNHSPSLVLVNELKSIASLPDRWKTKVQFSEAFGKTMAYIPTEFGTDLYGEGEVTGTLLRNGSVKKLWNSDNLHWEYDYGQRLYQSHPWVLGRMVLHLVFWPIIPGSKVFRWAMEFCFRLKDPPFLLLLSKVKRHREWYKCLVNLLEKWICRLYGV